MAANATTYTAKYSTAVDVLGGNYTTLMESFSAENGTGYDDVLNSVLGGNQLVPKLLVYGLNGVGNVLPTIQSMHRPTRVAATLGVTTPWDGIAYAFAGDLGPGNMVSVVRFPTGENGTPRPFLQGTVTTVPTLVTMDAAWLAAAGA